MMLATRGAGAHLLKEKPSFLRALLSIFNSALVTQQVQFADVSFYQGVIDWNRMATKAPAAIIRAGQNLWVDSQFVRNYSEAKRVGMKRGVYWFYDSRIHPDTQADILINLLKNDRPEMEIFCDWELNYGGSYFALPNAVRFMQRVEQGLPGSRLGMYTGYYFFRDNSSPTTNANEYAYLKNKALWLAWYTSNPAYVQIPAPWTKLTHWQWGTPAWGADWGVDSGNIDMNWHNGTVEEFNQAYGGTVPPSPPPPSNGGNMQEINYANGVRVITDYQYGSNLQIIVVPKSAIRTATFWKAKTSSGCELVQNVEGDIVFNFTPFNPANCIPNLGIKINGVTIQPYVNYNPWAAWEGDMSLTIHHQKTQFNSKPTVSQAFRYIVENGAKNPNTSSAWDDLHPRRLLANTQAGSTVIVSVKGRDAENRGCTLHELADLCLNHDAFHFDPIVMAIDGDSGSSVQGYYLEGPPQIFLGTWPADQSPVSVFGIIKLHEPLDGGVTPPPPPPSTEAYIKPITVWIDGVEYSTGEEDIPLEPVV